MNNIKTYANDLLEFFHQRYKLQNKPTIIFAQDKENSMKPFGKTAHYDPAEQSITVYTTGRHMKDCLRSLAHEMVHHLQNERGDLKNADEAFFTGTAVEITPITKLDQSNINDGKRGPVTKILQDLFVSIVSGQNSKYTDWLTFIK